MKQPGVKILQVILIFISVATTVVAEEMLTLDVGGKTVIMPSPKRLVSINQDPGLMKDFGDYVDPGATLLAGFVTKWDMSRRNKGEELNYDMYGEAVVAKAAIDVDVNTAAFEMGVRQSRQAYAGMTRAYVGESLDLNNLYVSPQLKVNETGFVKTLLEGPTSYSVVNLSRYENDEYTLASVSMILINSRIIKLHLYVGGNRKQELEWLNKTTKEWIDAVLKANS